MELQREIQSLKEANVKLKEEELKLKQANLMLTEENLRLSRENVQLSQDNLTVRSDATPTRQRISDLERELKDVKEKRQLEKPLVEIGVAIRLRFWEQAMSLRNVCTADESIIEAGNRAAHRGAILADTSLFHLEYMPLSSFVTAFESDKGHSEESLTEFFHTLYLIPLRDACFAHSEPSYGMFPKLVEFLNLCASMKSCSASYESYASTLDNLNADYSRFRELARSWIKECRALGDVGLEAPSSLKEKIDKMEEIVVRNTRLNLGRSRSKRAQDFQSS